MKEKTSPKRLPTRSQSHANVPPQALPLEEAVLGALMLDKEAIDIVLDVLKPAYFYSEAHRAIYRAILRLFNASRPIDLLTVTEALRKSGDLDKAGGPYYLVGLTNRVASAANIEYHARIIAQKYISRNIIEFCISTTRVAYEERIDVFELLDKVGGHYTELIAEFSSKIGKEMPQLMGEWMKRLEEKAKANEEEGLTGIPTDFTELDRMTGGWQKSDLIVLAARPGMGKTALALTLARNAAMDFGKKVAVFSLEMSEEQLVSRLVSIESEVSATNIRRGDLTEQDWQTLHTVAEKMSNAPIHIDDTPALNPYELRAKCRRLKIRNGLDMVIVDYLQLMSGSKDYRGNREQEISSISRSLKLLAKELNIPVIALSQLSRAVESRGGAKRPQLSDLRESGAIENDADLIAFIYRPEYYQILEDEAGNSLKGKAEVIIAKQRNGALGTVHLQFIARYAKFADLTDEALFYEADITASPGMPGLKEAELNKVF